MVIVLHGMRRNASEYRDFWVPAAEQYGLLVVAPHFTRRQWPGEASYNLGDVAKQPDPERWTYAAVEHLFDEVRGAREDYVLFGHSAGAQFAQRLGLLRPGHRARVIAAGNAGYYLWPEWRKDRSADPFPYSLVESPVGERELAAALARRFVLLLGDGDTDPKHPQLNRKPGALRQGAHRFERGENFFKQATAAARELGVEFAWELHEVAGVAHDGEAMSRHAAKVLFGKP